MKPIKLLPIIFLVGISANASTVNFASGDAINEYNSVTATNVLIGVNPAWQANGAGKWISYADTGTPGAFSLSGLNVLPRHLIEHIAGRHAIAGLIIQSPPSARWNASGLGAPPAA